MQVASRARGDYARAMAKLGDRSGFSTLEARAYLSHAAVAPLSDAVAARCNAVNADFARRGAGAFGTWVDQREQLRAKLARLIGAAADDIGFVPNTTYGLNALALSLPFSAGDRIVVFHGEYPSNVSPFQRLARARGLSLCFVPVSDFAGPEGPDFARFDAALAAGARLVAVSAVQFQTGLRMPLEALGARAHAAGAELIVDGVQALGAVPVSVASGAIDYLACGSHKWLMGPAGAGFVYVNPARRARFDPALVGSMSHVGALDMLMAGPGHLDYDRPLHPGPVAFEGGMINVSGFAGLEAAVDPILALGVDAIHAHVNTYLDVLEPALIARGFTSLRCADGERRSGILSLDPPQSGAAPAWVDRLQAEGIVVSCPDGRLRIAPHWPNAVDEVPAVLAAVDRVLGSI